MDNSLDHQILRICHFVEKKMVDVQMVESLTNPYSTISVNRWKVQNIFIIYTMAFW